MMDLLERENLKLEREMLNGLIGMKAEVRLFENIERVSTGQV